MSIRVTLRLSRRESWSRRRRLVFLLIFALAVSLGARTVFGERGLLEWWRLRAEAGRLEAEVDTLRASLAAERRAVADLREGSDAVERIARERLGMIRPGEVVYLLPVASAAGEMVTSVEGAAGDDALDHPEPGSDSP